MANYTYTAKRERGGPFSGELAGDSKAAVVAELRRKGFTVLRLDEKRSLPNLNELAWRWRDAIIYVTKGVPKEPAFSTAEIVDRMAPLPLAAIHATHDEFVPVSEVQRVMERAKDPKKLWIVQASNHRFSDNIDEFNERLLEALAWVKSQSGGSR